MDWAERLRDPPNGLLTARNTPTRISKAKSSVGPIFGMTATLVCPVSPQVGGKIGETIVEHRREIVQYTETRCKVAGHLAPVYYRLQHPRDGVGVLSGADVAGEDALVFVAGDVGDLGVVVSVAGGLGGVA